MGTNFKIGSFNAIDTTDAKKSTNSSKGNDDFRKRLLLFGGIILVGIIVLFLLLFLISIFFKKTYSYDDVEAIMVTAAEDYFKDHPKRLPQSENQRIEISVDTLASSEYMKELSEYFGDDSSCTGLVAVQMNGDSYLYIPQLSCGDDYTTQSLKDVVSQDVVTEGYGLYQVGDSYVYRGEDVNNYLQLDARLWRIVKITSDGNFMLILEDRPYQSFPWDDRYNTQIGYNSGMNNYTTSRIKDTLEDYYNITDEDSMLLSDKDKGNLVTFNLCIGKRNSSVTAKDNSIECSQILENQRIGLLTASDYMMASIDSNCNTIEADSCQNYNYLVSSYKWWLLTADNATSNKAYGVSSNGVVTSTTTSSYMYPRVVVMLNSNALFKSGKGTLTHPYKIK